jgi:alpha-tubulin suppressor-like RCC1 family protein
VSVAAGSQHSCALLATGSVRCWGANFSGQLGNGTTTRSLVPVFVSGLARAVAVVAGASHTCALLSEGAVRCWGSGQFGQLGDGTSSPGGITRPTPVAVLGLINAVAIVAGANYTCALRVDGTARCWGDNGAGGLGDGSTEQQTIPTPVVGLTGAVALTAAVGGGHTCALLADGSARCWGQNGDGQLGDGTTTDRPLPGAVAGVTGAVGISAGTSHTCALVASGGARCWGNNGSGQLGDGTTTDRLTATVVTARVVNLVQSFGGTAKVTLGQGHSCTLQATGAVACWGSNGQGQLGDGTTVSRLQPPGTLPTLTLASSTPSLPSFTFNIDPAVPLEGRTRVALVTILGACDVGRHVDLAVTVTQGAAVGEATGVGECKGGIERYPVAVLPQGPDAFADGPAVIEAVGRVQDSGVLVDTQVWTRDVQIATAPVAAARLGGSAVGLGRGPEKGGVSVTERLTVTAPVDLASSIATATITHLLDEIGGAGELVSRVPLTLQRLPGNDADRATFSTPEDAARPDVSLSIRRRAGGVFDLVLDVVGATIQRPEGCSPTQLLTSVTVDDGINAPVALPVVQAWNCATRGGLVQYLRTP